MSYAGHEEAWREWRAAMAGERMHHAWLLAGRRGVGKAAFAYQAARELVGGLVSGDHPDILVLTHPPKDDKEAGAISGKLREDRATLRARALKAVEVLKAQAGKAPVDPGRIGAVGFCFGGATVLELARSGAELAGVVSLHGGLSTNKPAGSGAVKTPILVLNGAADKSVTAEDIAAFQKEMDAAGADWQFVNFAGAVHCFAEADANSPPGCQYNPRAAKRAYRMLEDFFEERFGD